MQTSRGTSLSGSGSPRTVLFATVAAVVVAIDQLTKWWAVEELQGRDSIAVLGDVLSLTFVLNPGAAFGTGAGYTIVLTLVALVATAVLLFFARRLQDRVWAVGLGLFLGGAVGNLIDRLTREPGALRGHVVDMINYNDWFVGNVADMALTGAAVLIVVRAWQGIALDGTKEESAT